MEKKDEKDPLNCWGDRFWKRHLYGLWFFKWFVVYLVDMIEEKIWIPELFVILGSLYITSLTGVIAGAYKHIGLCYHFNESKVNDLPYLLNSNNLFPEYFHWFFVLAFFGNLKKSPLSMTIICASYSLYDAIISAVDSSLCPIYNENSSGWSGLMMYSYFRSILSWWAVYLWLAIIFLPKRYHRKAQIEPFISGGIAWIVAKILWLVRARKMSNTISTPFEYPTRIRAAALITFGASTVMMMGILLFSYQIYYFIDTLKDWKSYLEGRPYDSIFAAFNLEHEYTWTTGDGIDIVNAFIKLCEPLFPCALTALILSYLFVQYSIAVMLYKYKEIMLAIMEFRNESPLLKRVWSFSCHRAIFFPSEFMVNNVFLLYTFGAFIFLGLYVVSIIFIFNIPAYLLLDRPISFWLSFAPTIWSVLYFRFLVTKKNFIKNKRYMAFWDSWYFLVGFFGAIVKGLSRFGIGIGVSLFLGFRAHVSIVPTPFDVFDSLYCSFYASIALQCLSLGIIPDDIDSLDFSFGDKDIGPARRIN
ncbi:unnamed protein product [Blepharisma stoltei]|uniref:Uncharacterized protein n=1 Tax=Blepharisma stoltei TaxID=1481888 RepID=A0AAU9K1Q2_9CILI|nr:unnamed protein product [Blepharisma stoltei]